MLLLFIHHGHAQEFSLQIGTLGGFSKSKSFNEFRTYYNDQNIGFYKDELSKGSLNYGTDIQLNFSFGSLFTAFGFSNVFNKARSTFPNGANREILFNNRYYNILIGYKLSNEIETTELAIYTGFYVSDYVMRGYVVYPNGDKDYLKNYLSGMYQTQGFGVPLIAHYGHSIGATNLWLYGKLQIQAISATKFGVFDYQGLEKQITDDAKRILFEVGIEYKLK